MGRSISPVRVWVALAILSVLAGTQTPTPRIPATDGVVVVYGGTPSGILAAVTSARGGAKTILLEPTGHIGGMLPNGLVATDIDDKRTLGGYAEEFFDRIARRYAADGVETRWVFEPHVAEAVFEDMLRDAGVTVARDARLAEVGGVTREGSRLASITTSAGSFSAAVFVDASYGGDLMAAAGVSYAVGREAAETYGEPLAGAREGSKVMTSVYPLPPEISSNPPPGPPGSADHRIQDSNFRMCFSSDPGSRVAFSQPAGYDRTRYLVVGQFLQARELADVLTLYPTLPGMFDVNSSGFVSTAPTGMNWGWPEGSYAERDEIERLHAEYTRGYIWFLATDELVPSSVRNELAGYGWCPREWADNGHFPRNLYIREARRLMGMQTLTQHDIDPAANHRDAVGIGSYRIDSHAVTRWAEGSDIYVEGMLAAPAVNYAIPFPVMLPRREEATNLLVSVAVSASHVAWASLRMEPHFMMMGEAAGEAAATAALGRQGVHDISIRALRAALRSRGVPLPGAPCLLRQVIPAEMQVGVPAPVTVTYTDLLDQTCAGIVALTSSDPLAVLPPNLTFVDDGPGSITVDITLGTPGRHGVRARDTVLVDNTVVTSVTVRAP